MVVKLKNEQAISERLFDLEKAGKTESGSDV